MRRRRCVRGICAAVLVFEAMVVFFATLVALDLSDIDHTSLWLVCATASVACLTLAGLLRRRWAFIAGSVLQLLIIGTGVVVPTMFFLGAVFAGLWALAIFLGRRVERLQAAARPDGG
jgi:Protein of unknown function (DUF4233)